MSLPPKRSRSRRPSGHSAWEVEQASPEQRLIAAMLALAVDDAVGGDEAAARWIREEAPDWLIWLINDGSTVDAREVHRAMLAMIAVGETRSTTR